MFQISRKEKSFNALFSVMEKILKCNANPDSNYVHVRSIEVGGETKTILEVTDSCRCLKVVTTMIPVEIGRYNISKNADSWFLTPRKLTEDRYPDTDRIEVKQPTKTYRIAACVSRISSIYNCVINKKSDESEFVFFNPVFLDDFIKLVEMSYPEVVFKMDDRKYSAVQLEFENAMFEFKYIVMPMATASTDILEVVE